MRKAMLALIAGGLVLGGLLALLVVPGVRERVAGLGGISIGKATIGGPFTLVDHTGRRVTDRDFAGRHMLVFFGFTFCPDICPTALQVMAAALDKIGPKAERVTPVFITVDPERDTPEQLAQYVSSFHPRLVGLTGTPEEIAAVARAYRVYYRKTKDERSSAPYTMDHTSIVYLMDRRGEFITHFTHATPVDTIAARLEALL